MFADSFSGSLWMTGKAHDRQKGRVENLYMIYNNPRAVFAEKHRGGRIETARKDLFALFGGNLEKAL